MEELTDADLDPDFVEQTRMFTKHIYTKSETKTLSDGIQVNGRCKLVLNKHNASPGSLAFLSANSIWMD